jgi:hypothetical protein
LKLLVAISSCERDMLNGNNQAMRETWLPRLVDFPEVDYKFFVGLCQTDCPEDTISLPVCDDYRSLPFKTRESCRWALQKGYDAVFRAFVDTCVHPHRLFAAFNREADYVGHFPGGYSPEPDKQGHYAYASGGPGYWLSKRACEIVVRSEPTHWAEDLWIGDLMGKHGILGVHEPRFFFKWNKPHPDTISVHLSRATDLYSKLWMFRCWKELCAI